jgi:hypothetical protein
MKTVLEASKKAENIVKKNHSIMSNRERASMVSKLTARFISENNITRMV